MNWSNALLVSAFAVLATPSVASGCTAQQGQITSEVLTGLCDAGTVILAMPGALPICADINIVEQLIANWQKSNATGNTVTAPMTQTDLYMMVKASGKYKPARVK